VKKNKNHGWCIIIEGLSGSGKTSISKQILPHVQKKAGKTILFDGDDVREFLSSVKYKMGYKKTDRAKGAYPVSRLINLLLSNNINAIYANVGLNKKATKIWYKNFKNLIYVYVKTDVKDIIDFGKKDLYKKIKKNVVGLDIKPDINKKADIVIANNFDKSIKTLSRQMIKEINKIIS
jgi:adenylylsulfate kinase-like enzyme